MSLAHAHFTPVHVQPKLPGRFGFYDLRCKETLASQVDYAREIRHHRLLLLALLVCGETSALSASRRQCSALGHPEFRFILGWANESWSGVWHGAPNKVLVEQSYGARELAGHATLLSSYIESGQYLEVNGRFPFVIYKPMQVPNAADYLGQLRESTASYWS